MKFTECVMLLALDECFSKTNVYKWTKHWFVTTSHGRKDRPENRNTLTLW